MDNLNSEFKAFGRNIESISVYYGLFLILWGIIVSFMAKSSSLTSYIPSYIGLIIFLFSILSIKFPSNKKIFMHIVAVIGLVTFLGGLDIIRLVIKGSLFSNFWADISKVMMLFSGLYFVILCFKSFRHARKVSSEQNN
ncbi:MAG: hypothetical protein CMI86_02430 [Candidatus Pelagibacter sp.]|nr:hypothetical protein [Candidatus Pelagibacter sp.]|tara:strand:+ start:761 stop:1177 length:417 start_codon:yes stop_codon:yes gene_type:complete